MLEEHVRLDLNPGHDQGMQYDHFYQILFCYKCKNMIIVVLIKDITNFTSQFVHLKLKIFLVGCCIGLGGQDLSKMAFSLQDPIF